MEKAYWLSRKRKSLDMARSAAGSESRLVHYDLAGRYALKAGSTDTRSIESTDSLLLPLNETDSSTRSDDADDA